MEITGVMTLEIKDASQISEARREIDVIAKNAGMRQTDRDRTALLCTELGTNLIKHTPHGGQLIVHTLVEDEYVGMDIYSIDSGNGMDLSACLEDGFSSAGSLGIGLGAIKRLADECAIHSAAGIGSVIQTRIWNAKNKRSDFSIGGINVPKRGEILSGDKSVVIRKEQIIYVLVVDGLGHGIEAAEAAALAIKRFKENSTLEPAAMLKLIHTSLRGSRGAVGAVAKLDLSNRTLTYCGLGNIEGIIVSGTNRKHLVSLNGTLGYEAPKISEFKMPWTAGSILSMHTDGFSSKTFTTIAEVENESAALIAGWLYKQHAKDHDDATIIVLKHLRRE